MDKNRRGVSQERYALLGYLAEAGEKVPALRLGQLLAAACQRRGLDLFYVEDAQLHVLVENLLAEAREIGTQL